MTAATSLLLRRLHTAGLTDVVITGEGALTRAVALRRSTMRALEPDPAEACLIA